MQRIAKTLLVTLLLFFITTNIMAQEKQDKYEYVEILPSVPGTLVVVDGNEGRSVVIGKNKSPLWATLKEVNRMSKEEGWEVYNNSVDPNGSSHYYLRRKLKD
jgi:hypothetical protein